MNIHLFLRHKVFNEKNRTKHAIRRILFGRLTLRLGKGDRGGVISCDAMAISQELKRQNPFKREAISCDAMAIGQELKRQKPF